MKYATFGEDGQLNGRYDSNMHQVIPDGALEIPEELFLRTIDEYDGIWKIVDGAVTKVGFPDRPVVVRIADAHARINAAYQSAVNAMTTGYPQDEVKSWPKQEAEARAWLLNVNTATPWLDAASSARGLEKAILIAKVIEKANLFAPLHGQFTGKRQKLRDEIDALGPTPTQAQLDAIQW